MEINLYDLYNKIKDLEELVVYSGDMVDTEIFYGIVKENNKFYAVYRENNAGFYGVVNEYGADTEVEAIKDVNEFKNKILKMVEIDKTL